jgi:hypothetical protein
VRGWLRLGGMLLLSPFSRAMARAAAADPRVPGMVFWLLRRVPAWAHVVEVRPVGRLDERGFQHALR